MERDNPLDPASHHNIVVPRRVSGLTLSSAVQSNGELQIILNWNKISNADGYYVYRSFSPHASFVQIGEEQQKEENIYYDTEGIISNRDYWYKVSAYIEYSQGKLEGQLSDPVGIRTN